jgi:hypothetical protein
LVSSVCTVTVFVVVVRSNCRTVTVPAAEVVVLSRKAESVGGVVETTGLALAAHFDPSGADVMIQRFETMSHFATVPFESMYDDEVPSRQTVGNSSPSHVTVREYVAAAKPLEPGCCSSAESVPHVAVTWIVTAAESGQGPFRTLSV